MKASGSVRRIDDLGRAVIPKGIRRTMHIREGYNGENWKNTEDTLLYQFSNIPTYTLSRFYAISQATVTVSETSMSSGSIHANSPKRGMYVMKALRLSCISLRRSRAARTCGAAAR